MWWILPAIGIWFCVLIQITRPRWYVQTVAPTVRYSFNATGRYVNRAFSRYFVWLNRWDR